VSQCVAGCKGAFATTVFFARRRRSFKSTRHQRLSDCQRTGRRSLKFDPAQHYYTRRCRAQFELLIFLFEKLCSVTRPSPSCNSLWQSYIVYSILFCLRLPSLGIFAATSLDVVNIITYTTLYHNNVSRAYLAVVFQPLSLAAAQQPYGGLTLLYFARNGFFSSFFPFHTQCYDRTVAIT